MKRGVDTDLGTTRLSVRDSFGLAAISARLVADPRPIRSTRSSSVSAGELMRMVAAISGWSSASDSTTVRGAAALAHRDSAKASRTTGDGSSSR